MGEFLMEISLYYTGKTGGDHVSLHTPLKVETITTVRHESTHGRPRIDKHSEFKNLIDITPDGESVVTLTKVNAKTIAKLVETGSFVYQDESNEVFVNQLLEADKEVDDVVGKELTEEEEKAVKKAKSIEKAKATKAKNKAKKEAGSDAAPIAGKVTEI